MTMFVLESTLRLSSVTSIETVAPAGKLTPLVPVTGVVRFASKRSPILLVFVQTFDPDVNANCVPEAMTPLVGPAAAGGGAGVGAGALVAGGCERGCVARGRVGAAAGGATGTSFSCGWAAVSIARARSRAAESAAAAESIAAVSSQDRKSTRLNSSHSQI